MQMFVKYCIWVPDVIDDVNALLKLKVGDPYRLEHIKQTYVQNKKIWITAENYLKRLREKYLIKYNSDVSSEENIIFENESENDIQFIVGSVEKNVP